MVGRPQREWTMDSAAAKKQKKKQSAVVCLHSCQLSVIYVKRVKDQLHCEGKGKRR